MPIYRDWMLVNTIAAVVGVALISAIEFMGPSGSATLLAQLFENLGLLVLNVITFAGQAWAFRKKFFSFPAAAYVAVAVLFCLILLAVPLAIQYAVFGTNSPPVKPEKPDLSAVSTALVVGMAAIGLLALIAISAIEALIQWTVMRQVVSPLSAWLTWNILAGLASGLALLIWVGTVGLDTLSAEHRSFGAVVGSNLVTQTIALIGAAVRGIGVTRLVARPDTLN